MTASRTELRALTSVRGIAAWAVVLYHIRLSLDWAPRSAIDLLAKGYLAVDLFFLLSGFVIWMTWSARLREGGWREVPLFLKKRVARIWPLHVAVLGYAAALALTLWMTGRPDPRFPIAELPAHILLVQSWGLGAETLAWNDPAWSISTEMFAYLLFPLLAMRDNSRSLPSIALVVTIVVAIAVLAAVWHVRNVAKLGDYIPQLGLLRCIIEFGCGTVIATLWLRWRDRPFWPALIATATASAITAAYFDGLLSEPFAVPAAFASTLLVVALTSGKPGNPLDAGILHYLGQISFATYLSHSLLWKTFKLVLVDDPHAVPPMLVLLYLAIVLGASVALYHLIEHPAQRWVNALSFTRRRAVSL